jgi:UDP-N-acetyl-2-amino-2-deoxyglucuronate dehydrogenase
MPGITVALLTGAGGAHVNEYLQALADTVEAESVVVADPSGDSEASARRTLGDKLKGFSRDYSATLQTHRPGMALITLEAVESPPVIQGALEANCHVLAEKPSCVRVQDFEPLARLADMKHRHLTLALANRLRPTMQQARKLIQDGKLGDIYGCELHIVADQTRLKSAAYHQSWFADRARAGGGHLIWLGIHWLDLAMFLTDSRIVETAGFTGTVGGQPLKIEDSAVMALRFDNGSLGTITSGYYLDRGYHTHIKIWGSHGWLQLEPHGGGEPLLWYSQRDAAPEVKRYEGPAEQGSYTPLVQACVRAAAGQEEPPLSNGDCLHVLKTVFACYQAAATGMRQMV